MTPVFTEFLLVAAGGALGAMSRFGAGHLNLLTGARWGVTALVNIVGCLLIGVVWSALSHYNAGKGWYLFAVTGFLGGFTTFSAFSLDVIQLAHGGKMAEAIACAAVTFFGCLLACWAGFAGADRLFRVIS